MKMNEVDDADLRMIMQRILDDANIIAKQDHECMQCHKKIGVGTVCCVVGTTYFCSEECVLGD